MDLLSSCSSSPTPAPFPRPSSLSLTLPYTLALQLVSAFPSLLLPWDILPTGSCMAYFFICLKVLPTYKTMKSETSPRITSYMMYILISLSPLCMCVHTCFSPCSIAVKRHHDEQGNYDKRKQFIETWGSLFHYLHGRKRESM